MLTMNEMIAIVEGILPAGSTLIQTESAVILSADIDDDGWEELIAPCFIFKVPCLMVFKRVEEEEWSLVGKVMGEGKNVSFFDMASVIPDSRGEIIVGWDTGNVSKLGIYSWGEGYLSPLLNEHVSFHKIELEDMPAQGKLDGIHEIALWMHETGEAYQVGVFRLKKGRIVPAYEVYPYYYQKVEDYYAKQTRYSPT